MAHWPPLRNHAMETIRRPHAHNYQARVARQFHKTEMQPNCGTYATRPQYIVIVQKQDIVLVPPDGRRDSGGEAARGTKIPASRHQRYPLVAIKCGGQSGALERAVVDNNDVRHARDESVSNGLKAQLSTVPVGNRHGANRRGFN